MIVYSAITAGYDSVKVQPKSVGKVITFDEADIPYHNVDPCRTAKFSKVMSPWYWWGVDDYSVWVDGSITLNEGTDFAALIDEHLKFVDIAVMKHPHRTCVYQEAEACIKRNKDDPRVIERQVERYMNDGHPSNHLLSETGVLIRRHTENTKRFCSMWWDEITRGSRRDQISFPYVAWKLKIPYVQIPERFYTVHPHTRGA